MNQTRRAHPATAAIAALGLLWSPVAPLVAAQSAPAPAAPQSKPATAAPSKPAASQPKPAAASQAKPAGAPAAGAAIDGGWPRYYDTPSGASILVYQPQIASWDKQTHIVAFSAVSYRTPTAEKPAMGTVKFESNTQVSVSERLVRFDRIKVTETNFQTLPKEQVQEITARIDDAIPDEERIIALDRVLANINDSDIVPKDVQGIKADPPPVFFSTKPAVLVNLDGDAIWSPIKDNDLKYAVNTNWDLFQHTPTTTYYLRNNNTWLKASDVNGPWTAATSLPASFKKLPDDDNWKDVKAALPAAGAKPAAVPTVFISNKPAELILLTGEPKYVLVPGTTDLLWVSNTESDVFRMGRTGPVYYLVAGRWFSSPGFDGPWTFATPSLPAEFKKIPLEHPRSRVLASVPGTNQAAEAVLLSQIPQTARVNKRDTKAPEVSFQGDPQFTPIEKTTVERAVNTDKDVFKVNGRYYMCYQGVWFVGSSASGPWEVASTVPQEIYQIPASSPSYHVTYVTVEEDNDDWVVYAAAAGYTGMMVAWGCTVWGTGWYYPPYYGYGGFYPYYYPGFPTYGYSAWYNPWTGAYGRSAVAYGPYGGAGVGARYNPRTGTYARGAAAYGPYGARGVAQAYNPRTGTYASTRQGSNVYGSWGSTSVQRGDDWARTNRYTNRQTGTTTRTVRTDQGNAVTRRGAGGGTVAAGSGGNVYAGNDGNVYRRENGTWQKYDNGNWTNTDRQPGNKPQPTNRGTAGTTNRTTPATAGTTNRTTPTDRATTDQLNRDSRARTEGAQRTNDYSNYRSGTGKSGTGSYRGSSGGARPRGGGGRRR